MQVNNVEALDSFPTDTTPSTTPTTGSSAATPLTENAPAPPKQSTIKIQSPPAKATKKDDSITVAMRQASEEAASKAKDTPSSTSKPGAGPTESSNTSPTAGGGEQKAPGEENVRRKSIIGEIAEEVKRPKLVPENAAVSSANLHADNPAALRDHHRGSIVSATSKEERDRVAQDLRKSISGGHEEMLESLRRGPQEDQGAVRTIEAIEQDPFEDD